MANTIPSPNMNLPVPVPGTTPGQDWADDINACISGIDSHTHTSGQGVPITTNAININADLSFNNFNGTTYRSVRFASQGVAISAPTDIGCIYEAGVDLYYNDGNGNQIRITQSGSVAGSTGTITGLPSGTASASFGGGAFTFESATSTPATMNVGPLVIGRSAASSKTVTIAPNAAQAANYALTLPTALPASASIISVDNTGAMGSLTANLVPGQCLVANSTGITSNAFTGSGSFVVASVSPTITTPILVTPAISDAAFSGTSTGTITSGVYTPTVVTGIGSSGAATANTFSYLRINTRVTVFGRLTGSTDSSGILLLYVTLPINPTANFSTGTQVVGLCDNESGGSSATSVAARTSNKQAIVELVIPTLTSTPIATSVSFTYDCA